jgi:hypothetical protein
MAKKIDIIGAKPKRIHIVNPPKPPLDPAAVAEGLGARPCGERIEGNLDPIGLAALGTQLLARLRSSGGRPALADATEICRVPLSADDLNALEKLTAEIEQNTGKKPAVGQVVGVIVRDYLTRRPAKSGAALENEPNEPHKSVAAWLPRLAEIARQANTVQQTASAIQAATNEMQKDIEGAK